MRRLVNLSRVAVVCGVLVVAAGCGDDGPTKPPLQNNKLILDFYNTPPLGAPWVYQVWAFKNGWQSGPTFRLNADADLLDTQGQAIADNKVTFANLDLTTCDSLRVTLRTQTSGDGGLVVLLAAIGTTHSPRLESGFKGHVGARDLYFVYATPSDADTTHDNELSGVWFADIDLVSPGLDSLPPLPDGWIFEGWAKHGDVLLSTGKFMANTGPDLANEYYTGDGLDLPGEDFLDPTKAPTGITFPFTFDEGDTVMITLEPEDDFDLSQPFIRWFAHEVPLQSSALWPREQRYLLSQFPTTDWPAANAFITTE